MKHPVCSTPGHYDIQNTRYAAHQIITTFTNPVCSTADHYDIQHTRCAAHQIITFTNPVCSTADHYDIQHTRYAAHQIIMRTFNTHGMQHTISLRHTTHQLTCPYNILKTYASSVSLLNNERGIEKNLQRCMNSGPPCCHTSSCEWSVAGKKVQS